MVTQLLWCELKVDVDEFVLECWVAPPDRLEAKFDSALVTVKWQRHDLDFRWLGTIIVLSLHQLQFIFSDREERNLFKSHFNIFIFSAD